jgi:hypothetical protein
VTNALDNLHMVVKQRVDRFPLFFASAVFAKTKSAISTISPLLPGWQFVQSASKASFPSCSSSAVADQRVVPGS